VAVLVLVVDDESDVEALFRQQFRRELRAERFVMHFAASASDALARVANAAEQSPALVFSDINMPSPRLHQRTTQPAPSGIGPHAARAKSHWCMCRRCPVSCL